MRLPLVVSLLLLAPLPAWSEDDERGPQEVVAEWLGNAAQAPALEIEFTQERKLETVNRPLTSTGRIWIEPGQRLRWQIGDPPSRIVIATTPEEPVLLIDARRQTWQQIDPTAAAEQSEIASLRAMLDGRSGDLATFEQAFDIRDAEPLPKSPEWWKLDLRLKDRRARLAVTTVTFIVHPASGALQSMTFAMRDGSTHRTRIDRADPVERHDPALFQPDLEGYTEIQE